MATFDTPAGPRRIIIRSLGLGTSESMQVTGMIYSDNMGVIAEFTSSVDLRRDIALLHMVQQIEVAVARSLGASLGLTAPEGAAP